MAADAYYQAVEDEDWGYTYDHLDSETQSEFTRDEWFAKNEWGANTSPATFTVQYVQMDDSSPNTLANVTVLLTLEDGSTSIRDTFFVYEDGLWKHRFSAQEYEILANAKTAPASASSSASQSTSGSPDPLLMPPPTATTMLRNPRCQVVVLRRLVVGVTSTAIRLTGPFEPRPGTLTISMVTG